MKGREELFSFKIPAPSGPGAKIGRPRPSTTATPRKFPLHSHSAFKPFARYSDRLLGTTLAVPRDKDVGGAFQHVPLCHTASQTGCVIPYASYRSTAPPPANTLFRQVAAAD